MKFTTAQKNYHWLSAGLILIMAATGMAYFYEVGGSTPMVIHQITGHLLIVVLALRIIARLARPTPDVVSHHHEVEQYLARAVQFLLYLTLIAFVLTGYVSASAETDSMLLAPVGLSFARSDTGERFLEIHYMLKWVLLGLVTIHIAGALKHHFWDKDSTLIQMTYTSRKG